MSPQPTHMPVEKPVSSWEFASSGQEKDLGLLSPLETRLKDKVYFFLCFQNVKVGFPQEITCFAVDRDLCSLFNGLLEGLLSFESFLLYGQHPLGLDFLGMVTYACYRSTRNMLRQEDIF